MIDKRLEMTHLANRTTCMFKERGIRANFSPRNTFFKVTKSSTIFNAIKGDFSINGEILSFRIANKIISNTIVLFSTMTSTERKVIKTTLDKFSKSRWSRISIQLRHLQPPHIPKLCSGYQNLRFK